MNAFGAFFFLGDDGVDFDRVDTRDTGDVGGLGGGGGVAGGDRGA